MLKAKPEYVLTTSEFNDVKERLSAMHAHHKLDPQQKDDSRPHLKRTPGSGPVDADDDGKTPKGDEDDRPTLKKRTSDQSGQ